MSSLFPTFLSVWQRVKRVLATDTRDISPTLNDIVQQVRAVYNPDLEPIIVGGVIVEWVDRRTGQRPLFS
jgi:hypothetical protein